MISISGAILCTGNLVQDTVVAPVDEISYGATRWVDRLDQHLGGNGANTSYAIGILGGRVRLQGCIGADAAGAEIRRQLESVGVDTSLLQTGREPTAATVALVKPDGSRAFLHRLGASAEAFADFTGFNTAHASTHYHLANPFTLPRFRAKAALALRSARDLGLTCSLDTGWDSRGDWMRMLAPCLPLIDLLFANEDEARMLTGHADPFKAVAAFRDGGARDVVIKLGSRGALVFEASSLEPFASAALPIEAVDTTGAGDCFVGGFLAALQRGFDYPRAAQLANAAGALSVSAFGGVTGLRSFEETMAMLHATFITPLDRDEIHKLIKNLDDVLDTMQDADDGASDL